MEDALYSRLPLPGSEPPWHLVVVIGSMVFALLDDKLVMALVPGRRR